MQIVIDANIPLGTEFFSSLGEVIAVPPREIDHEHLKHADALVVRSVKKITGEMVKDTPIKFVGTCTAGFDHLEIEALDDLGVAWSNAPGCNAKAVVEYVFSVFSALTLPWRTATVGIIGCGNVGGLLHRRLKQFGVSCRCYDPFLKKSANQDLVDLESVLASDIICMHAPLSTSGPFPSLHLLNEQRLRRLKHGAILINAGRGPVIDNKALLRVLNQRKDIRCILDVWEEEPIISQPLAEKVELATPHIAGHSYDGKVRGTEQIYQALCQFLNIIPSLSLSDLEPQPNLPSIELSENSGTELEQSVLSAYDVRLDHQRLMEGLRADEDPALCFDQLRKNYPKRREFSNFKVNLASKENKLFDDLKILEFQFSSD